MRTAALTKYRAVKTVVDGIRFDSKAEAARYSQLKLLEKAGEIRDLVLQEEFTLLPHFVRNNKRHRGISYVADFSYTNKDGVECVEDVKGFETADFKIKMKLFLREFGDNMNYYLIKKGVKHEV